MSRTDALSAVLLTTLTCTDASTGIGFWNFARNELIRLPSDRCAASWSRAHSNAYTPCVIGPPNNSRRAATGSTWMGLWSPDS